MNNRGFTIVELVVVILLLGIVATVALPRFIDATDEARLSVAQHTTGAFVEALNNVRSEWFAKGKPPNLTVDAKNLTFVNDWPHPTTLTTANCMDLWDTAFRAGEPIQPYVANQPAPAWSAIGFTSACIFVYHEGQTYGAGNLLPFFLYQPRNGSIWVQRYNMS